MEGIDDISVDIGEKEYFLRIMQLENGISLFISPSSQPRLGPIAVASPPSLGRTDPSSSSLFGSERETSLVRTIAERVAVWTNQTCLAVVSVKSLNLTIVMDLLKALKPHLLS